MAEIKEIILNKYAEFEKELNGQTGTLIHDARKSAIKEFESIGLPGPKNEEYKYTFLTRLVSKEIDFSKSASKSNLSKNEIEGFHFPNEQANVLFFVNGFFKSELSKIISPDSELIISDLHTAFKTHPLDVQQHFGNHLNHKDSFGALNTAFGKQGVFIKVSKNTVLSYPIVIHNITDSTDSVQHYYPRNLFIIGENSQAKVIETFQAVGSKISFVNHASEIIISPSANVEYYKIQEDADVAFRVDNTQIIQSKDSVFNAFTFTFSGKLIRNNLNIILKDEHCETHMFGLYMLKGSSHVDNHTVVDHEKANSFSNEIYKGILDEQSTGVFNGKIFVRAGAQKTNAFQSNKNILLTDQATINTKPQLEIWADDVKCSHGCTTGQLDEEELFYLRSRGISKEKARALLLTAFAEDILEKINVDFIREHLHHKILSRLTQ